MDANNTHPYILYWIPQYLRLQGTRQLTSFPQLPQLLLWFGREQDAIGWQYFTEGKISKQLFQLQSS